MKKKSYSRKQYLIKNSSQPELIFKTYLILLVVMLLSGGIFYFLGNRALTEEYFQAHSLLKTTMELLLPSLFLVGVIGLAGAFVLVVLFTHSIAGPIYRFRMLSERIARGDLTVKVSFRKRDSIQELAGALNQVIQGLNSRLRQTEGSLGKLKQLSQKVRGISQLSEKELGDLKEDLLGVSTELELKMKDFKL